MMLNRCFWYFLPIVWKANKCDNNIKIVLCFPKKVGFKIKHLCQMRKALIFQSDY